MNKKIMGLTLGIVAVMLVAVFAIGAISASNPTEVSVGDQKFHIPDGYKETNSTDLNGTLVKTFTAGNGSVIVINVFKSPGKVSSLPAMGDEVNKTIAGISGLYDGKTHTFRYVKDSVYIICISSPDEATLETIIK